MCTDRYINLFTDWGFKRAFGNAANKDYMVCLLNTLIDDPDPITDITYRNVEKIGLIEAERGAVYDLYCTTQSGAHVIVEMQNAKQKYFVDRSIYYSSYPMWEEADKGRWDYKLPKIYTIAFLNFNMPVFDGDTNFRHIVQLTDLESKRVVFDKLTYIYIELPKFTLTEDQISDHDMLNAWLFIIKNMDSLREMPRNLQSEIFQRFFRMAEIAAFKREDRLAYEESLKKMRDIINTLDTAREDGIAIGEARGIAIGEERGIAIGEERGAKAKALQIARTMLRQGIDPSVVSDLTGLSESEVNGMPR